MSIEHTTEPSEEDRDEYTSDKLLAGHFDFLDAKADQWMAELSVQAMANAMASVFEKYASQEIMDRFREKLGGMMHQCFVEGALRAWLDISEQGGLVRIVKGDNDPRALIPTDDSRIGEVLRPFANYATALLSRRSKHQPDSELVFGIDGAHVTLGDLRRARDFIALGEMSWDYAPPAALAEPNDDDLRTARAILLALNPNQPDLMQAARLVAAYRVALATTRLAASREGGEERLGEAMFILSDRLRASGFLDDAANHAAYEKVVAAFQSLASPAPIPETQTAYYERIIAGLNKQLTEQFELTTKLSADLLASRCAPIEGEITEASPELVIHIARAVMVWGRPHFKHMVSFNVLREAIELGFRRAALGLVQDKEV